MRPSGYNPFVPQSGLPARSLGDRAGNPRSGAFSGGNLSRTAGGRAAGDFINPFISTHVPMLWDALIAQFGRPLLFWLDGDDTQQIAIVAIWKEGAADEDVSPGRYSRALVKNADLPRPPQLGDVVSKDTIEYDVVRVDATPYDTVSIVLQDRTETF